MGGLGCAKHFSGIRRSILHAMDEKAFSVAKRYAVCRVIFVIASVLVWHNLVHADGTVDEPDINGGINIFNL